MSENKTNKSNSLKKITDGIRSKLKKTDKTKLFGKILAGVLAFMMVISIAATCIYALISMMG